MTKHTDEIFEIIEAVVNGRVDMDDAEIFAAVDKIEALTAKKAPEKHKEIELLSLEGDLIELAIRYEGGHTEVVGRVRLVHGNMAVDTVLWIGEACVPVDAVVYMDSIGKRWVFDSKRHNAPNAPLPSKRDLPQRFWNRNEAGPTYTNFETEGVHPDVVKAIRAREQAAREAAENDPLMKLLDAADDPNNADVTRIHDEITVHDASEMKLLDMKVEN